MLFWMWNDRLPQRLQRVCVLLWRLPAPTSLLAQMPLLALHQVRKYRPSCRVELTEGSRSLSLLSHCASMKSHRAHTALWRCFAAQFPRKGEAAL